MPSYGNMKVINLLNPSLETVLQIINDSDSYISIHIKRSEILPNGIKSNPSLRLLRQQNVIHIGFKMNLTNEMNQHFRVVNNVRYANNERYSEEYKKGAIFLIKLHNELPDFELGNINSDLLFKEVLHDVKNAS